MGDLVLLQAGERVPADGVMVTGRLSADQSALNGESREVEKRPGTAPVGTLSGEDALASPSALLRGTVICSGEAVMRVTAVGDHTFYGSLAREVQDETRESPLKVRLSMLARTLSRIGYCAAVLVAIADLFNSILLDNGFDPARIAASCSDLPNLMSILLHALTLAITVVVVAVPEGLPMMITLVLSRNMRRMLKDNVLVRKLVGIETSGSLNILFTDKTGTLTRGKLQVSRLVGGDGTVYSKPGELRRTGLWKLVELSCARNNESMASAGKALGGNATDRALLEYVLPLSPNLEPADERGRVPFDSARKFSAVRLRGAKAITLVKGAPEKILPACHRYYDADGKVRDLQNRSRVSSAWNEMTGHAMRVLALAVSETEVTERGEFSRLILVGLLGIRDEVRPDVKSAVCQVRKAGVQVVMITGDNKDTAAAIARECGLLPPAGSAPAGGSARAVITSSELAGLSDAELRRRLPELRVVARALPSDKSRLVQARPGPRAGGRHDRGRHQRRPRPQKSRRGLCHGQRHRGGQGGGRYRHPRRQFRLHRPGHPLWAHHLQEHPQIYHLPADYEPVCGGRVGHRPLYRHRHARDRHPDAVDQHHHGHPGAAWPLPASRRSRSIWSEPPKKAGRAGAQPLYAQPDSLHGAVYRDRCACCFLKLPWFERAVPARQRRRST